MCKFLKFLTLFCSLSFSVLASDTLILGLSVGMGNQENSDEVYSANNQAWVESELDFSFLMRAEVNLMLGLYFSAAYMASWSGGSQEYVYGENDGTTTTVNDLDTDIRTKAFLLGIKYKFDLVLFAPYLGAGLIKGDLELRHSNEEFNEKVGRSANSNNPDIADLGGHYLEAGFDIDFLKFFGLRIGAIAFRKKSEAFTTLNNQKITLNGVVFHAGAHLRF